MSDKQTVYELLGRLPENATIEQISEEVAIVASIQRGEEGAQAGRVVPHAKTRNLVKSGWFFPRLPA